jgi:hypothetical protein
VKIGDIVRKAHWGSLAPKEEFHEHSMKKWGAGIVTKLLPAGHLDWDGSEVPFERYEVLWSLPNWIRVHNPQELEQMS